MKILHTADWQLGKPFAGIRDERKRALVQQARLDAVQRIGEIAEREGAACIVVAGDLFDSVQPDQSTVASACSAIGAIGRPVYVIPGNHDHGGAGSLWHQDFYLRQQKELAPNLTVLLEPKAVEIEGAVVLPCPLLRKRSVEDPTLWLRSPDLYASLASDRPRIVLAHGSTQTFTSVWEDEEERGEGAQILNLDRLPLAELDYIALGDWHGTKKIQEKAWYAGTPEPDRFTKGDEHDPGNILMVELERGAVPEVKRFPTGGLSWQELAFEFSHDEDLAAFREQLDQRLGQRSNQDLLHLAVSGTLGIEASHKLEEILESLEARLLRVKCTHRVRIAPTEEELRELTELTTDPLIARTASRLAEQSAGNDAAAEVARTALRELYAVCRGEGAT